MHVANSPISALSKETVMKSDVYVVVSGIVEENPKNLQTLDDLKTEPQKSKN